MSNALMIVGLLGLMAGIIAPVFRVFNKKPKYSKAWVLVTILFFLVFVLGVILGI